MTLSASTSHKRAYLQWRLVQESDGHLRTLADVIRQHRDEHAQDWLSGACQEAIASGEVESVLRRYLHQTT